MQGVDINDKHIEVIVSQMLGKVKIEEPGDTRSSAGCALYSKREFDEANEKARGRRPETGDAEKWFCWVSQKHPWRQIRSFQRHLSRKRREFSPMLPSRARVDQSSEA